MRTLAFLAALAMMLSTGCAAPQMYTSDGFITDHGVRVTIEERDAVVARCTSQFTRLQSDRYDCLGGLVPLAVRFDNLYGQIMSDAIQTSRAIVRRFESAEITEKSAIQMLDAVNSTFELKEQIFIEQYDRVVSARNAREQEEARKRLGAALSSVGEELLRQSAPESSKSITCRETVPGTVSCSEW